jgi:hypothetical protein
LIKTMPDPILAKPIDDVKVVGADEATTITDSYIVNSRAGETSISAGVSITGGVPSIISWDISP